jgi:hypothetical protein
MKHSVIIFAIFCIQQNLNLKAQCNTSVNLKMIPIQPCKGEEVKFIAVDVNGGNTPEYRFYVNGILQNSTKNTMLYIPQKNDSISVEVTSSLDCATNNISTSYINFIPYSITNAGIKISKIEYNSGYVTLDVDTSTMYGTNDKIEWIYGATLDDVNQKYLTKKQSFLTNTDGFFKANITNSRGCTYTTELFNLFSKGNEWKLVNSNGKIQQVVKKIDEKKVCELRNFDERGNLNEICDYDSTGEIIGNCRSVSLDSFLNHLIAKLKIHDTDAIFKLLDPELIKNDMHFNKSKLDIINSIWFEGYMSSLDFMDITKFETFKTYTNQDENVFIVYIYVSFDNINKEVRIVLIKNENNYIISQPEG